jgi:glycosyltransferase involved in cell wall biosynthesis
VEQIYLSVVIPCYEEMANLRKGVLDRVHYFLEKQEYPFEVIIVDDGSQDGSVEFLKAFAAETPTFKLIQNPHTGKAGAVTTGVLQAKGKYVLFTDMDQATPIEEAKELLPYFAKGYDIVIGSRSNRRKGSPLSRLIISRANMMLRKFIVGLKDITDTQCGFKLFSHEAAQKIFTKVSTTHNGFTKITGSAVKAGFDVELLLFGQHMGYKIKEVPVSWLYVESRRVSPVKDSIEGVLDLLRIKQNDMAGKYR